MKEAIKHCFEIEKSCDDKQCALDHHQLRLWLTELLNIKLRRIFDEEEIIVQPLKGDAESLTRDDIWGLWPPTEKREYGLVRIPDYNEDCTHIKMMVSAEEFEKVKKFKILKFEPYEIGND